MTCIFPKVTSKIYGNSIFLPTTLYRDRIRVGPDGHGNYHGYYWSSSLCTVEPDDAWNMHFASVYFQMSHESRCRGMSVRPVTE